MDQIIERVNRMPGYQIKKILIHPDVSETPVARQIAEKMRGVPVEITENPSNVIHSTSRAANIAQGKRVLWVTKQTGDFLHACPGTPGMVCCNYYVLDVIENCPLDCTYCFLQGYLNTPFTTVYANIGDLFTQVKRLRGSLPDKIIRIGTGELSDSLALADLTGITSQLIEFFLTQRGVILELKTKTNHIGELEKFRPGGRVVIAWSVNPDSIAESDEIHAAPLAERFEAARQCAEWGYRIAFHFDPLIRIPGWREEYAAVVDRMFSYIPAEKIAWVSLGTLRFFPALESTIKERFPKSKIMYGEQFPGKDGKLRYIRPLREEMYREVISRLRRYAPRTPVYLCMESEQVWKNVFGWSPSCRDPWEEYFDQGKGETGHGAHHIAGNHEPVFRGTREHGPDGAPGITDFG